LGVPTGKPPDRSGFHGSFRDPAQLANSNYSSYYTCPMPATGCSDRGIYFVGRCRSDRPSDAFKNLLHKNLKPNQKRRVSKDGIIAASFKDKHKTKYTVNLLTNKYGCIVAIQYKKPKLAYEFSANKGPLDHFDQYVKLYTTPHRQSDISMTLYNFLMRTVLVNSMTLFSHLNNVEIHQKEFLLDVTDKLVTCRRSRRH